MAAPRDRAVSIVLDDAGDLLVIRRRKYGRDYCVLPGGGLEEWESARDAALRELMEETGLRGCIVRKLWTTQHADRTAHYYLVTAAPGPLRLGGPERDLQSRANHYRPEWIPLSEVAQANLQPAELRPLLVDLRR